MKTISIKMLGGHAQLNLTDNQNEELQRLLDEEKDKENHQSLEKLALQAIRKFPMKEEE